MTWVDWEYVGWRPDKSEIGALHKAWGATRKERNADLHQYINWHFGKASTKELTWKEYQQAMEVNDFDQRPAESM